MSRTSVDPPRDHGFRHEAAFYDGIGGFANVTAPFIRDGIAAAEPILVVLTPDKIELLQAELGVDADRVTFADMASVGHNPARIIPAWQDFLLGNPGSVRGIGEPIWAERSPDALVECERHEALLNVAFEGGRPWSLLCPYDSRTLDADTLRVARRNHPLLRTDGDTTTSATYPGVVAFRGAGESLAPIPPDAVSVVFVGEALEDVRNVAESFAASHGFRSRREDVRIVAQELSSNAVRHGGGGGVLQIWAAGDELLLEVRSDGRVADPLIGRRRPVADIGGYGLWIVNQVADLVQIRDHDHGTIVRAHFD